MLWRALNSESNKLKAITQQDTLVHRNKDLSFLAREMEDEGEDEEIVVPDEEVEFLDEDDFEIVDVEDDE